jgi:hypothetical protein
MRIDGSSSSSPKGLAPLSFGGVTLNTSLVRLAGCAWLVRFGLTNGAQSTKVVDLECDAGLTYVASYDFDRVGFTWANGEVNYTCLCRSCALVRDVSTYWIGSEANLSNNYWTQSFIESYTVQSDLGGAFSWQGLSIAPADSTTVGVVFQSGVFRGKPVLPLFESNGIILDGSG